MVTQGGEQRGANNNLENITRHQRVNLALGCTGSSTSYLSLRTLTVLKCNQSSEVAEKLLQKYISEFHPKSLYFRKQTKNHCSTFYMTLKISVIPSAWKLPFIFSIHSLCQALSVCFVNTQHIEG